MKKKFLWDFRKCLSNQTTLTFLVKIIPKKIAVPNCSFYTVLPNCWVPNCPTTYYITSSSLQARLLDDPDITKKMIGNRPNTYTFTKVGMLKMFCKRVIAWILFENVFQALAESLLATEASGLPVRFFCICSPSYISHVCFLAFAQIDIFDNPSAYSAFHLDISHFWQYLSESVHMYFWTFLIYFAWSICGSFLNFIPNTHFLGVYHETKHSFCKFEGALSRMGWQFQWWDSLFSIDEVKVFRQWSDHLIPHSMHLKTNIVENMDMRQSKQALKLVEEDALEILSSTIYYSETLYNTLSHYVTLCHTLVHSVTPCNTVSHSVTLCNTL